VKNSDKKAVFLSILIIGLLFIAGWVGVYNSGLVNPSSNSTRQAISQLQYACDDYLEEYSILPLGSTTTEDRTHSTSGKTPNSLMNTLVGLEGAALENPKERCFFEFKRSRGNSGDLLRDGLLRTEDCAQLYDPWGNPYYVLLDYDGDRKLKDPHSGEIIEGNRALIWSLGPDGKSGTKKTNKDNIYSWTRSK